jgi:A/G-specific adenine glycosylase
MSFASILLSWYDQNARELPWRSHITPYRTWISEVMLQQTQVATVIPYFGKWMARFPDIPTLAAAEEQDVLALWEGLGYYSRARYLYMAAKQLVNQFNGQLPQTVKELEKLPGIGPYTARAIASIAFGQNEAAVDGNIRRVFSRYGNVGEPARSLEGEKKLIALAESNLPKGRAGDYNQALMDLGATLCTPKTPDCIHCPLADGCVARQLGIQEKRPVKLPRKKVPHLTVTAAVICRDHQVLLAQRPSKGLLGGLWEFPGGTLEAEDANHEGCLNREIREELGVEIKIGEPFGEYHHAYTHFKITLFAYLCKLTDGQIPQSLASDQILWVSLAELPDYPMGKVDRRIAERLMTKGWDGLISS